MLTIRELTKTYANGVNALNNIFLEIPNGMFGLLGPNGAGKSSLMRTIATLQEPDTGSAMLDGIDIFREKEKLRQVLGYLPQEFGCYPRMSPEVMLNHFALLKGYVVKGERKDMVDHLLHQTNLWDVRKKSVDTFSGGMKQRFGIAQALIGSPKLVIVDEPTAGLDPSERNRFHNILAELGENIVVILSTHIVEDVSDLCPLMAIMGNGEILLYGETGQVLEKFRGLIWRKNIEMNLLEEYQKRYKVISSHLVGGNRFIHIISEEAPGDGFEQIEANLEDVYFATLKNSNISVTV